MTFFYFQMIFHYQLFPFIEFESMKNSYQVVPIKRKARAVSSFLKKTFQLLNDDQNRDAVKWASNGIGFVVVNEDLFSKKVLPSYFKHSNYSSFVRQLNMYNFHKIRENHSQSYFHHECFDRQNESKLAEIKRKPEKKKRKNEESDEEVFSSNQIRETRKISSNKKEKQSQIYEQSEGRHSTEKKIESQKITNHFFSSEHNEDKQLQLGNSKVFGIEEESDDKISINNEISERIVPRLPTRQLFYPSNNNLFPFGGVMGQTSTFCIFF